MLPVSVEVEVSMVALEYVCSELQLGAAALPVAAPATPAPAPTATATASADNSATTAVVKAIVNLIASPKSRSVPWPVWISTDLCPCT
jgi:hypothetical protein